MKKDNVKIKENITLEDKVNAITDIVESYFINGEYTPYYAEMGTTIAIVNNFVEGLDFDDEELISEAVQNDEETRELIEKVITSVHPMNFVDKYVADMVEFRKQKLIRKNETMDKLGEFFDIVVGALEGFSNLGLKQLTPNDIEIGRKVLSELVENGVSLENLTDVVKNAVDFNMDKASAEIIDAKNEQIDELTKKIVAFKNKESAKNVISDKK